MKILGKVLVVISVLFLFTKNPEAGRDDNLNGFSDESSRLQLSLEAKLKATLKPANAERLLRELTSRPHLAGTDGSRITAEFIKKELTQYGLPAEIETYQAFLSAPVSTSVALIHPVTETIPTIEEKIEGDPFTADVEKHPAWAAYSASGEASGEVVYAHHGSETDLAAIRRLGIDLKGKILLLRYFGTGEGTKVRNAEREGAIGVLLYSDPKEDGYRYGDVYPEGNWRPPGSIMRRPVIRLWDEGDPLSPGWASVAGARRLNVKDVDLPKIPVIPISYRSAEKILRQIRGPLAPHEMQGDLPLPYKLGPGPARIRMKAVMDNGDRPILNVLSRIPGEKYPDQWIIVGNHHDAWIYGAGDPSSGTASLLEFARGLGELIREGYRPKRSLVLAFWDAEELLLGGSTEFVEHHKQELLKKAVACINMDSSVFNTTRPLSVNSHPLLHRLFRDTTRNISDPKTGKSLFENWRDMQNEFRQTPSVDGWGYFFDPSRELKEPWIFESPSDDAAPFFHHLALPASDMYYGADYGMYHSIYENFHWMKTVVDPTFEYHIMMALLQGYVSLRLANADLLQLDYAGEARYWRMAYEQLKENGNDVPAIDQAFKTIDAWEREAVELDRERQQVLAGFKEVKASKLSDWNRQYFLVARDFYRETGSTDSKLERNLWSGSSGILPGIAGALDRKDRSQLEQESALYLQALQRRVESLKRLREELKQLL